VDVRETETEVVVEAEVPGLKADELDVSVSNGTLTIRGERKSEREEKEGDYHMTERSHGSFSRVVSLPAAVKADGAAAKHENGIVTITLPKTEHAKPKKIEVKGM
jgi:HSP20 family protein